MSVGVDRERVVRHRFPTMLHDLPEPPLFDCQIVEVEVTVRIGVGDPMWPSTRWQGVNFPIGQTVMIIIDLLAFHAEGDLAVDEDNLGAR